MSVSRSLSGIVFLAVPTLVIGLLSSCASVSSPGNNEPSPSGSPETVATPSPSPSGDTGAETFTAGAPSDQCTTKQLSIAVSTESASAGHLHYLITFTNNGPQCSLSGFPVVQVAKAGTPFGSVASQDTASAPVTVPIATGASAYAQLTVVNVDPGGGPLGSACTVDHGDALFITAPHGTIVTPIPVDSFAACSNNTDWFTVGSISATS